jgi:hypothetical protein
MNGHSADKNSEIVKAGALLCPICCVEYIKLIVDFEVDGTILKNIELLKCPICQDEQFTPEQQEAFEKQIRK